MNILIHTPILAAFDPEALLSHAGLILAILIVLLAITFGLKDLLRLSPRRIWAISSVCFSESIRRRVLWITPLAIIGVMVVSTLQRPVDEQDAIRQTTKFCLFTTGMVVVIVGILLASTSLPKEIENRVIFTIVTKPTTRLEIVLGKTLGFARVSATILLIMGLFAAVYLKAKSWSLERDISLRLENNAVDPMTRPSLEHYRQAGLLNAKTYATTEDLQFYGILPEPGTARRYANSNGDGQILIPFDLTPDMFDGIADPNGFAMRLACTLGAIHNPAAKVVAVSTQPTTRTITGPTPLLASTRPLAPAQPSVPTAAIGILDSDEIVLLSTPDLDDSRTIQLNVDGETDFAIPVKTTGVEKLLDTAKSQTRRVYVSLAGSDPNYLYYVDSGPCVIQTQHHLADGSIQTRTFLPATENGKPVPAIYRGGYSRYGQQLRGSEKPGPVAVFHFRQSEPVDHGPADFELRLGIDRTGAETSDEATALTRLRVQVRNTGTGKVSEPVIVQPETNRTAFFTMPADSVAGGEFDVIINSPTPQHEIGLKPSGLLMVTDTGHFAFNLLKSLTIFWLLSVLVVSVAIFCSTFVSWPIAVVLCLVILMGKWGVDQLGDAMKPGIGASVTTDAGIRDPRGARVVSSSVEMLTKILSTVSHVMPDISQFPATEDIERGVSIPIDKLRLALSEAVAFGLPLLLLGYVIFKNKEVAP